MQGKEDVSEGLLGSALNATIASRLRILEAYTGSGPALGEDLGAITLRVLNYLRKEEEASDKELYKYFSGINKRDIEDALRDLLETGKAYEPSSGIYRPVPI